MSIPYQYIESFGVAYKGNKLGFNQVRTQSKIFFVRTVIPPLITSDFMQTLNNNVTKIYTICTSRSNLVYTIDSLPMGSNPLISLNNYTIYRTKCLMYV